MGPKRVHDELLSTSAHLGVDRVDDRATGAGGGLVLGDHRVERGLRARHEVRVAAPQPLAEVALALDLVAHRVERGVRALDERAHLGPHEREVDPELLALGLMVWRGGVVRRGG